MSRRPDGFASPEWFQNRARRLEQRVVGIEVVDVLARDDLVLARTPPAAPACAPAGRAPGGSGRRRSARESSRPTRRAACAARAARRARRARRSGRRWRRSPSRPASWNARAAPSALGSLAAPDQDVLRASNARRCRRTRSSDVLNWPSPSSETTGQARPSRSTSLSPAITPRIRARGSGPARASSSSRISSTCAVPALPRPARQVASRQQARLVVVRAEVGRAGMRDVDGDHRDVRLVVARRRWPAPPIRRSGTRSRDRRPRESGARRCAARSSADSGCRRR